MFYRCAYTDHAESGRGGQKGRSTDRVLMRVSLPSSRLDLQVCEFTQQPKDVRSVPDC